MKLRFEVDQAKAFRRGIDVPKSIVTVEVNPADVPQEHRNLIADRLVGIDVCQRARLSDGTAQNPNGKQFRIMAESPTFDSLVVAVVKDEQEFQHSITEIVGDLEKDKLRKEKAEALLKAKYGPENP